MPPPGIASTLLALPYLAAPISYRPAACICPADVLNKLRSGPPGERRERALYSAVFDPRHNPGE